MEFGEIVRGVLREGPGTQFAVRSALAKGREKKTILFRGGKYSLAK